MARSRGGSAAKRSHANADTLISELFRLLHWFTEQLWSDKQKCSWHECQRRDRDAVYTREIKNPMHGLFFRNIHTKWERKTNNLTIDFASAAQFPLYCIVFYAHRLLLNAFFDLLISLRLLLLLLTLCGYICSIMFSIKKEIITWNERFDL